MAIVSRAKCRKTCNGTCTICTIDYPDPKDCLVCSTHCPCCNGLKQNLCGQCSEENCENRTAPYKSDHPKEE